jgi:hypothetical protein
MQWKVRPPYKTYSVPYINYLWTLTYLIRTTLINKDIINEPKINISIKKEKKEEKRDKNKYKIRNEVEEVDHLMID